jgi:hypothetical protein
MQQRGLGEVAVREIEAVEKLGECAHRAQNRNWRTPRKRKSTHGTVSLDEVPVP